jgi:hypothetical protein
MAGLPADVTARAAALVSERLANQSSALTRVAEDPALYQPMSGTDVAPPTRDGAEREFTLALAGVNLVAMTPLDALNLLFALQQRALASLGAPAPHSIPGSEAHE